MAKQRKTRNKTTNYDVDIHIRIQKEFYDKLKEEAEKEGVTQSLMLRYIIERYFNTKQTCENKESLLEYIYD